ncbi:MAG TPA: P-loop NTPase [Acidimicrobiia bacterium]|nr:P-loop NTPase [Acidimicrobiia bacterium]
MDLLAYFRVLRRHWRLIVAVTVAGAALGAASTLLDQSSPTAKTYYRATHTLVFDANQQGEGGAPRHYANPNQVPIFVTTGDVPDAVAKKLGTSEPGRDLAAQISTTVNDQADTLDITAVDPDAQRAVQLADTFATELIASLNAKEQAAFTADVNQITDRLNTYQKQRDALLPQMLANPQDEFIRSQYDAAVQNYGNTYQQYLQRVGAGAPTSAVSDLEPAEAIPISSAEYSARLAAGESGDNHFTAGNQNTSLQTATSGSSFDDPVSRGILGGLLGLLAGVGLALVANKLDRRIRTRDQAEAAYGLPILAEVPRLSAAQQRQHEVVAVSSPLSRAAEAYRAIRTSLMFQQAAVLAAERGPAPPSGNGADHDGHDSLFEPQPQEPFVVMVSSASPGEGKTTTSANLAVVFAEAGSSVLLLNCDFRRPALHEMFGLQDEPRRVQDTSVDGVKLVSNVLVDAGANPAQVVAAQRQVIAAARDRFDVVILDTSPLLTANDAVEVVSSADLVLLVARPDLSTTDAAERSMDLLNRLDAPLSGVVLVAAADVGNEYYYYYQRGRVSEPPGRRRKAREAQSNGKAAAVQPDTSDVFWPAAPQQAEEPKT